jgi:hypothetical protein
MIMIMKLVSVCHPRDVRMHARWENSVYPLRRTNHSTDGDVRLACRLVGRPVRGFELGRAADVAKAKAADAERAKAADAAKAAADAKAALPEPAEAKVGKVSKAAKSAAAAAAPAAAENFPQGKKASSAVEKKESAEATAATKARRCASAESNAGAKVAFGDAKAGPVDEEREEGEYTSDFDDKEMVPESRGAGRSRKPLRV